MKFPRGRWGVAAVVLVLVLAGLAYWWRPSSPPAGAAPTAAPGTLSSAAPAPLSASQVEHGIEVARETVKAHPDDADSWAMLAHSYEMIGRFDEASRAYQQLQALRPKDAQVLSDHADALGVAQHGSLQGEPAALIARALAIDPKQLKALVLAGKESFERKQFAAAIDFWQRALASAADTQVRRSIETSIAEARALSAPAAAPAASAPAGLAFVAGRVTVAAALQSKIQPDDTVFVSARPIEGSRMPVALLRRHGRDLPLDFALDDSLAMVPQSRLSQQARVMVSVHVSRRGDAIPASGDLEGEIGPVPLGATGLRLEIDHARP